MTDLPSQQPTDEVKTQETPKPIVHPYVGCDVCGVYPIVGVRYKCLWCTGYDLCEACEAKAEAESQPLGRHQKAHPLFRIPEPVRRHWTPDSPVEVPESVGPCVHCHQQSPTESGNDCWLS